ncbi:6-hydroxymethylpterin diphosphokinase MptE-like protein [Butyrivibrio sp. AC2005]|uniref:6-hydroxymethylpterin diphosphokinase MptE-like protein n=1 Tax=Butyrivibrio sp. AC2005 TaxID=1280672 RepID=UPI0004011F2E|nr:6-hydroxymethylpterin diphosphokinase MptE-like protein [Butyrivibrio sp. AC2005]
MNIEKKKVLIKKSMAKHMNNTLLYMFWTIINKNKKEILLKNKKFENIHLGKRCFILGNGPSIKAVNFADLKNEYVFTVNQFARFENAVDIKSNYHFWADESFFKDDNSDGSKEVIETMKKISMDNADVVSFFPIGKRGFVTSHGINKNMRVSYFCSTYKLEDHMDEKIDYSKFTPQFGSVVQWCITMAIYMGFSEIYLLGCDNTGIANIVKSALKKDTEYDYGYVMSEAEKKRMQKLVNDKSLEAYVEAYLGELKDYRILYNYCLGRQIKLINCSAETVIDSIPRMKLDDVLNN